jgi:UrcA family protein
MSKNNFLRRRIAAPLCVLAAAGAAFAVSAAGPVQAQPGYDTERPSDVGDVIVRAPRHLGRSPTTGAPYELVSASRVVHYDDLDLRTHRGVSKLKARITRAANSACDELDTMYPATAPDDPPCAPTAVRDAMYRIPVAYHHNDYDRW